MKTFQCIINYNLKHINKFSYLLNLQDLLEWINNELAEKRIVVRDIDEDLYDGQILSILMGNTVNKIKYNNKNQTLLEILT